jgi:hypothetical protein
MRARSFDHGSAKLGRACLLIAATALSLLACGAADHAVTQGSAEAGAAPAQVSSGVNVCPHFEGSLVMPQRIGPTESAQIAVRASDPDAADSLLVFAWSAPSGSFSADDKPVTSYTCGELGTEQLTVTARDGHDCIDELKINVECVAN